MRVFFLLGILCTAHLASTEKPTPITLIVFIHGTIGLRHHLSLKTAWTLLRDSVEHTHYKKSISLIRNDPFFYQNQTMQTRGFQGIQKKPQKHHAIAPVFAQLYEQLNPEKFHGKTLYYTFGWSGLASHKERVKAAHEFYEGYQNILHDIEKTYGVIPTTEVVGYSHGGTVALLCEEVRQLQQDDPPFTIDRLILIGMPVQSDTERYICSPLFKEIFHCYSRSDNIQCLDCFSTKRFFSRRRFNHRAYCTLPDSLHQIEIRITTRKVHKNRGVRINKSPGHMELWFFGWPTTLYRSSFPFYPLPTAVFLPYITALAEKESSKHLVIELQPDTGYATVRPRFNYKIKKVPFFTYAQLQPYQKEALRYKPDHFTESLYSAHVHNAIGHAYELRALKKVTKRNSLCGT